jgi:beta-galactosidase/beta-glucuronidase
LDGGQGVFRKTLQVKSLDRRLVLRFDGAFMDVDVYINGAKVAENHWWNPFSVDVTDQLTVGENAIAVHVTANQPNSRWYSSAGIQRKVWLDECEPEGTPGVELFKVTTPNVANEAGGLVTTRVSMKLTREAAVQIYVKDASGKALAYGAAKGKDI